MRINKRLFRGKPRYGYPVHFTKRGDRISSANFDIAETDPVRFQKSLRKYIRAFEFRFMRPKYRVVKVTVLLDGSCISTVCLMTNHQFRYFGKPLTFETMVFDRKDDLNGECWRYATLSEARKGHYEMVKICKKRK
jgi:hypothetical protein